MTPIHIGSKRGHWLVMTIASACFAVAGIFILVKDGPTSPVGWSSLIFFGACTLVGGWQLRDSGPRITISDDGVLDRTLKVGVIAWNDMEGASLRRIKGNAFVALELRDAEKYTSRLSPLLQRLAKANVALGFTPLSLNLSGVDVDPEQFMDLLMKEWMLRSDAAMRPNADLPA